MKTKIKIQNKIIPRQVCVKSASNMRKRGFSLVEMLVAIAVFMSIMTIAISSLISIISANKKSQAIKSTVDNVTFALENISRDMRTGINYYCHGAEGFSKECGEEGSSIIGYNRGSGENEGVVYKYYGLDEEKPFLTRTFCDFNDGAFDGCGPEMTLISRDSGINIQNMKFYIIGSDNEFNYSARIQPRAVITASGLISSKGSLDTSFNLQTNISQRARR